MSTTIATNLTISKDLARSISVNDSPGIIFDDGDAQVMLVKKGTSYLLSLTGWAPNNSHLSVLPDYPIQLLVVPAGFDLTTLTANPNPSTALINIKLQANEPFVLNTPICPGGLYFSATNNTNDVDVHVTLVVASSN